MSRSRSTASTAEKTSAMSTGCRPTMHAPALRNGKKPRRPVWASGTGGGATPYGGGYATVPPGKKPWPSPGGGIPYLKIAVAVIVIIFIWTSLPGPERASALRVKRTGSGPSGFCLPNLQRRSRANPVSGMPAAHSRTFRDGKTLAGELLAAMHRVGVLGVMYPE